MNSVFRNWLKARKWVSSETFTYGWQWGLWAKFISDFHYFVPPVPAGSPSRGGDVTVYAFDINQPSLPTPFYSVLVYFCLYGPFNCISFHKFSRELSTFSLCSSGPPSALSVLSAVYLFVKVSFSPDIILCDWLGLKHQKNWLNCSAHLHHSTTIPLMCTCLLTKHGQTDVARTNVFP